MDIWYLDKLVKENNIFRTLVIDNNEKTILIKDNKNYIKKINKLIKKKKISHLVLSKSLWHINEKLECQIINGKKLFNLLTSDAITKICMMCQKPIEDENISVLTNENSESNIYNIINIAKNVKRLNVVTERKEKFLKIQDYLYENFGILLRVSNNKKSDLINSNIIINFDFGEKINQYSINDKAVVLNINCGKDIANRKFNGINIKDYTIYCDKSYKKNGYDDKLVYEANIYKYGFKSALKKLVDDNVHITGFIGSRGPIQEQEFIAV